MEGILYRDRRIYRGVLRLLYGDALARRERIVARLVPRGASVVDVCCGDAAIARRLPGRRYLGLDASEAFVRDLSRSGVPVRRLDVSMETVPEADVVLMLGSLYQFLPRADAVLARLRSAARLRVVIAEPYANLAQSRFAPVRALAKRLTVPGGAGSSERRFDEPTLWALLQRHGATEIRRTKRELVGVLPGFLA